MATGAQLQQVMMTSSHQCDDVIVDQVTQQVAELEATREQLEQDLFTANQSLEELQSAHVKVKNTVCGRFVDWSYIRGSIVYMFLVKRIKHKVVCMFRTDIRTVHVLSYLQVQQLHEEASQR